MLVELMSFTVELQPSSRGWSLLVGCATRKQMAETKRFRKILGWTITGIGRRKEGRLWSEPWWVDRKIYTIANIQGKLLRSNMIVSDFLALMAKGVSSSASVIRAHIPFRRKTERMTSSSILI